MSDTQKLLITADLNKSLSISELNKAIKSIENSGQLKKIQLKVDVNQNILIIIKEFNKCISEINQKMVQQNNNNIKVANSINNIANATTKETQAINTQTQALAKNDAIRHSIASRSDSKKSTNTTTETKYNNIIKLSDTGLVNGNDVKVADDYNEKLKDINSTVNNTSNESKEAKLESLNFGDAMKTAFQKFPINIQVGVKLL